LSTTLLSGITGISLHMQCPLISQSHGRYPVVLLEMCHLKVLYAYANAVAPTADSPFCHPHFL
jgi:hypothetical protein